MQAAEALGIEPARLLKTLMARVGDAVGVCSRRPICCACWARPRRTYAEGGSTSAHSRVSGNPERHCKRCNGLGPRFRGDEREKLFRRLRFRQVIERGDDVLGQRGGERGALMRVAHQSDAAAWQFRETFRGGEHAHAGA